MLDDLNTRFIEVMLKLGHSKSSFAKALDVSLPLITHITNGRNKPGIELIQKLLQTYQDIDARWFLLGEGQMFAKMQEVPDFDDVMAEISRLSSQTEASTTHLQVVKQYHKILIDEVLHLEELNLQLDEVSTEVQKVAKQIMQLRNKIEMKLIVE
jgi:transcriptional regulator with XRE-family HTH domain